MNKLEKILLKVQKPAWYSGGEYNSVVKKDDKNVSIRYAFCFPDLYDVGMSHLGIKILYHLLNTRADTWCERVFMPNTDMEAIMHEEDILLFGLESRDPIKDFDFIGFTLQYELSYTNILSMLDLAKLPLFSKDRTDEMPIVMAGGPCVCNPEPIADFIDLFVFGEGEEILIRLMDIYNKTKHNKKEFLKLASLEDCVYVPSLFDGNRKIKRAIVKDLNTSYFPDKFIVPSSEVVHDRMTLELMRGCIRGCRFCQAGFLYRPFRQKSPEVLLSTAKKLYEATGYDEISLLSLSSSDYDKLPVLADSLLDFCTPNNVNIALPSLRIDNFSPELLSKLNAVRTSNLTFAPEAGTQRLRDVINKNITEDDIFNTCKIAFNGGCTGVKLYFMIGLPTETDEDIAGIADIAQRIVDYYYSIPGKKSKAITVTISLATFIPKPFTPFQWEPQIPLEEIHRKQNYLRSLIRSKRITYHWHEGKTSVMEGIMARGDRKIGNLIYSAWKKGCKLDAWDEHFKYDKWLEALDDCGITAAEYAGRHFDKNEALPWDFMDAGVSKEFLLCESKAAYENKTSPNCKEQCIGCGVTDICGGDVCAKN